MATVTAEVQERVLEPPRRGTWRVDHATLVDDVLAHKSSHLVLAVIAGALTTWITSLAWIWVLPGSALSYILFSLAPDYWFYRLTRQGSYRRALHVARRAESSSNPTEAVIWRFNRTTCHIVLGEFEEALRILDGMADSQQLTGISVDLNLATLYIRALEPERALEILERIAPRPRTRPEGYVFHSDRAIASLMIGDLGRALEEIDLAASAERLPRLHAYCLLLKSVMLLESRRTVTEITAVHDEALRLLAGEDDRPWPSVMVNRARIQLDALGDGQKAMDLLVDVFEREHELGGYDRAQFHYLLARCYQQAGLWSDAAGVLERAGGLRVPPILRPRFAALQHAQRERRTVEDLRIAPAPGGP